MQPNSRPSKVWLKRVLAILSLAGSAVLPLACGSDNNPAPTPAAQPGTVPPIPSPTPSASPTVPVLHGWLGASETKQCPFPDCPARNGFHVDELGNYAYGLDAGPATKTGIISHADLLQLAAAADVVAAQDLSGGTNCEALQVLPGMSSLSVQIELDDGSAQTTFDQNTALHETCHQGNLTLARNLADTLDELANKYAGP